MRKTLLSAAAALLVAAPAYAQTSTTNPSTAPSNGSTTPPSTSAPSTPSATTPSTTSSSGVSSEFRQMRASDLVGKSVYSQAGEEIGEIDDVAVNSKTRTTAAIVSSGGFLGIGGRKAAVPLSQLKMQGDRVVASNLTREDFARIGEYRSEDWASYEGDRTLGEAVGE